jgi:hypothetical protein
MRLASRSRSRFSRATMKWSNERIRFCCWHIALFRCHATIRWLRERSGLRQAIRPAQFTAAVGSNDRPGDFARRG